MKSIRWQTLRDLPVLFSPPEIEPAQQALRLQALERDIMLPIKLVLLIAIYYFLFVSLPTENLTLRLMPSMEIVTRWLVTVEHLQNLYWVYLGLNLVVAGALVAMSYLSLKFVQWVVFTVGILDGIFLAALTLVTGGFDSLLYWVFLGLIIRNAFSIPLTLQQLVMNFCVCLCYVGGGLLDVAIFTFDDGPPLEGTTEPFVLRATLLLFMTVCCYALQVLVEKQVRTLEETGEFAVRQEQLRAAGRVAAEIAHRIKNPLAIINNAAFTLQRTLKDPPPVANQQIEIIREEVARSDRIVTELMGYAKLNEGIVERLSVPAELDRAIEQVLPAGAAFAVQVERHYAPNLPALLMQRAHLNEIFVNLLLNAREAMHNQGRIEIAVRPGEKHAVLVTITDSGPGIPSDKREKVFEPFYTTREHGTGLGLAIVKHNVDLYGGTVRVESELGKGARFVLHFPARTLVTLPATT